MVGEARERCEKSGRQFIVEDVYLGVYTVCIKFQYNCRLNDAIGCYISFYVVFLRILVGSYIAVFAVYRFLSQFCINPS